MNLFQTVLVAVVEGLTEFLPVSSTGHMIIVQKMLGMESTEFVKAFTVNIQFGAILAVVALYGKRFFQSFSFYGTLLVAVLPALVLGFLLGDFIDALLENVAVVAVMLFLGGVLMLFVDKWFDRPSENQAVGWKRALTIGFCQCLAMAPGVSRSMASIVGGMATRLTRKTAAEFSFFLAVPTMAAASGYKLLKLVTGEAGGRLLLEQWPTLLIGNVVAFVVALAAIKGFIGFLAKHGFKAFAYYRMAVGLLLIGLLLLGVDLKIP